MSCYIKYGTLITPLGVGMDLHYNALMSNESAISLQLEKGFEEVDLYLAKINESNEKRYNTLLNQACNELIEIYGFDFLKSDSTGFILSTTKANLDDLPNDTFQSSRIILKDKFSNPNQPVFISNACISGVMAINLAADYIALKKYENVVVIGIDVLSDFIVNGFQSLRALSSTPCKPFDENRTGVTLGEACAAVVVSNSKSDTFCVEFIGGASSNDANHISGPSRTGEGLVRAVNLTLERSGIDKSEIDFISAHGTATLFNDEMEVIGFNRLELQHIPTNSFKGTFGHTLGAAGVVEVILSMLSMEKNTLFKSVGFDKLGTTQMVNIVTENTKSTINTVLKTASGFGGGNAAILIRKAL